MNDDTAIKIMQSLGLDYNPAINSTLQFQKTVGGLNTQLEDFKKLAMQSAKDVNDAFSSQLGQSGNNQLIKSFKDVQLESIKMSNSISEGFKKSGNSIEQFGVTTKKTFKDAENDVYKYIETYKNLEKGINVSDTYAKNKQGGFDFQGRVVNDKSLEVDYRSIQKAHAEALKLNVAFDDTIAKNHQLAKDSAWKQHFQGIADSSDEMKKLNAYYLDLEKSSAKSYDKAHAEALKMNKTRDAEIAKIKESTLEQMKAQTASVQQKASAKGLSQEYSQQAGTLREQLSAIQARLQAEGKLSAEEVAQTNQLKEQLDILRAQTDTAIRDDSRLNPPTPENKASWFTDGAKFYAITKAAKEATSTIKDVEMGMVEISRVMTDTSFVFDEYRDNLFKLGIDYGQTFDNVQSVALRWAQSGYNVADSLKLTETSMLALNTAELDATQATESMIGIMAQWQLQAEDLALVMDKVNLTADSYSITSQDLVDGLLRSSSAAKNMNMTLDETIGLLTVMREASGRTGAEVGNALNSILSYIQRPKSIDTLQDMGIQMFTDDTESQFRNALGIFKDISTSWGSLSAEIQDGFVKSADDAGLFNEELATAIGMQEQWNDVQQRDVSQASAGVYRRNYFIGMIERMSNVQGVLNGMMDAEGYSMAENAKTMEALEKKQQSLKTSVEQLSVAMGDAGLGGSLKLLADGGTKALGVFDKLPKGAKDTILTFTEIVVAVKALDYGMKTFGISIPGVSQALASLTSGTMSLTAALSAGKAGLTAFFAANAPLLAIATVTAGIVALVNAIKRAKEEQEKFIQTTKDNIKSLDEEKQGLQELSKEYDTLKTKEKNLTATAEEKIRLRDIQRELVELYGVSITGIDAEGQAYSDSAEAIRDKIKAMEEEKAFEEAKLENAVKASDIQDVKDLQKNLDERKKIAQDLLVAQAEMDRLEGALIRKEKVVVNGPYGLESTLDPTVDHDYGVLQNFITEQAKILTKLNTSNGEINDAINEGTADRQQYLRVQAGDIVQQLSENGTTVSDSMRLYADGMARSLSQAPRDIYTLSDELQDAIKDFTSSDFEEWAEKYNDAISNNDTKGIEEAKTKVMEIVREFTEGKPELDTFAIAMENAFNGEKVDGNAIQSAINGVPEATEDAAKAFDDATDKLSGYYRILDEVNSKEGLSAKSKRDIISNYQELLPYLSDEQELRNQLIEIISQEEETQREAYANMILSSEEFCNAKNKGYSDLVVALNEYYDIELENFKSLADAKGKVEAELVGKLSGIWAQYYGAISRGNTHTATMLEDMVMKKMHGWEDANEVLSTLHEIGDIENSIKNIALDLNGIDFKGINSSGAKGAKSSSASKTKEENKALQEALKLLEHRKRISEETQASIRNELAELQRINSLYVKSAQERMDMAERIYSTEKRLRDRTLQDSVSWISEKKNFNEMSVKDEISAWTRVRDNQTDNIEAQKRATLELYKLKNQVMIDAYNREENTIQHLTKVSVLSVEQQIEQYRKLYTFKVTSLAEEQKRTENLFSLYKSLISDQQKTIKDAHDNRIKQIDDERKAAIERVESESKARKDAQDEVIKGIEKELALLNKQEDEYDHDKKMADLREQLAYWEVRTSEDARKKVIDLKKQIDEAEHKREIELQRQALEEKKKAAQDEIKNVEDSSREEIKIIEETAKKDKEIAEQSYKDIEIAFDSHKIDMIALASTMSEGMFDKFKENYLDKIQDALTSGDYGSVGGILGDMDGFFDETSDFVGDYGSNWGTSGNGSGNQSSPNDAKIYNLASTIAELKKQYALGNNPDASSFTKPLYEELSKLSPDISDYLRDNDYVKAEEYVKRLPTMHEGGKSLSYGAVYMKPGELTFPPDLSVGLERLFPLLSNLGKSNIRTESHSFTDNKKQIKIENLLRIDNNHMEDDVDERSLSRELKRQLTNLM